MRIALPALVALSTIFAAPAQATPKTVSDYEDALATTAARLEGEVSQRQKAGDMDAAQRLILAAAMTRRVAEEFRAAEQDYLTDDVASLAAPVPARVAAALAEARKGEEGEASKAGFADEAQRVFNALLDALPTKNPHPVFYGLLSRDLTTAPLPADLVVYGYRLQDPVYDAQPEVRIGRQTLPSVVAGDILRVTLPDDLKTSLGFAPAPCQSRPGFGVRVNAVYAERRGLFWPLSWHTQVATSADFFALPTPVAYAAAIEVGAQSSAASMTARSFQRRSELALADCGETRAVEVRAALPEGASGATCSARWVDASGAVRATSACTVERGGVVARGEIAGGGRICSPDNLCTCPNAAQGFLEAEVNYRIADAQREVEATAEAPVVFAAGSPVETTLAAREGRRVRHVTLQISRRDCPKPFDRIDLDAGDDPQGRAQAVSKGGGFRASLAGARLQVGVAEGFVAEVGRAP